MKNPLLLFLIPLVLLVVGCNPTNELVVDTGQVCLNMYGKSNCMTQSNQMFRLHLVADSAQLDRVHPDASLEFADFVQYGKPRPLPAASYDVTVKGGTIFLRDSLLTLEIPGEMGLIIMINNGMVMYSSPIEEDCGKFPLVFQNGTIMRKLQNVGSSITISSQVVDMDPDGTAIIEKLVEMAIALRAIPGDTGTEIVILDDFTPKLNECCEEDYMTCCGEGDGSVGNTDPVEPEPSLAESGYVLPIEDACVWEDCHRVVVVNCQTGEVRCYDTLECEVTISLSGDYVVITTSDGCSSAPALTICPV